MILSSKHALCGLFCLFFFFFSLRQISLSAQSYAPIHADMVYNMTGLGNAYALFDQNPATVYAPEHSNGFEAVPAEIVLRLNPSGTNTLTQISFHTAPGAKGAVQIFTGTPGQWQPMSTQPLSYGNGITGLAWYPMMQNVRFVKAVFTHLPGDTQYLKTGELLFQMSGDYAYNDTDACSGGQANCRKAKHSFDKYIGVNNFLGKTQLTNQFAPFTNIREYLPWDHIQGHILSGTSTFAEDHLFRFSPAFPGYDIDRHYANMHSSGHELLVDLKESSPFQMFFDYNGGQGQSLNQLGLSFNQLGGAYLDLMERKPGRPEGGVNPQSLGFNQPYTYADHGEAVYQTALRFGTGGNTTKAQFADSGSKANQGTAKWIENWNEQDKYWIQPNIQSPVQADKEKRLAFFTPKEYMAMTYADQNQQSGKPALPMVMSGLAELDVEYLKGMYMAWWELTGNDPSVQGWPFHAINYHHYSVHNWQYGIAPEKDTYLNGFAANAPLSRITQFCNKYLQNSELWITEFGYSDHPQDLTSARANYPNADYEEVQAQWIVRSYLHYYRYGVDKAFAYQLVDDGPDQWPGTFNHTGMVDRTDAGGGAPTYAFKKAWYYTYTLSQHLKDMHFKTESNGQTQTGRPVRRYDFESIDQQKQMSAIWIPEDTNPASDFYQLQMNGHTKAQIIRLEDQKIAGVSEYVEDQDGDGLIWLQGISERPILVLFDTIQQLSECDCQTEYTLKSGNSAGFQALTDKKAAIPATDHPRCAYGPAGGNEWHPSQAETILVNLGGGSETDLWQINSIYLNDPAWNKGAVLFELLDTAGSVVYNWTDQLDGEPMYPYNIQGAQYVWKTYDQINKTGATLRITNPGNVRVGELVICAKSVSGSTSTPPVTPPVVPPVVPPVTPPVTPPNVPPAPPTTVPVACDCAPFPVAPKRVVYDFTPNQTLPSSNTLFSSCLDAAADKSPSRMFDEQYPHILGMICSADYDLQSAVPDYTDCYTAPQEGYPIREWFPGWSNQYPYKAIVEFEEPVEFLSMFLYDSNDEGQISIEYRADTTEQWKTLSLDGKKTINTNQYRKWRRISKSETELSAKQLRVTMLSQSARFSELAFCGKKIIRRDDLKPGNADLLEMGPVMREVSTLREISPTQHAPSTSLTPSTWTVYPNPADRFFTVSDIPAEATSLVLQDMTGRILKSEALSSDNRSMTISVQDLPTGVYLLTARNANQIYAFERVIVK